MHKLFYLFWVLILSIRTILSFGQLPTEHLQLWLMADSVVEHNGKVSQWTDLTKFNNHAFQVDINKQPAVINNALNGHSIVRFDGIDDFLSFSELDSIRTVFIVFKHISGSSSSYQPLLGHSVYYDFVGNTGDLLFNYSYLSPFIKTGIVKINNEITNPQTIKKPIKYSLISIKSSGNLRAEYITNDRNNFGYWNGDFAEVLIYDSLINEVEQIIIEDYLFNKYAPKLTLGSAIIIPYSLCDTMLSIDTSFSTILWSNGDTTCNTIVNSSGTYFVQAKDIFGRMQYDTIDIMFPNTQIDNQTICEGDSILLKSPLLDAYSFEWSNGAIADSAYFSNAGTHWLKITDTLGCSNTAFFTISIDSFPNTNLLNNDTTLCSGNPLSIIPNIANIQTYLWHPGLTTDSVCIVSNEGWYHVQVENQNNCFAHDSIYVHIKGEAPHARFNAQNFCLGDTTNFIDLSTPAGSISSWKWVINNTDTINTKNTNYLFNADGNQSIRLIVETFETCSDDTSAVIHINPIINPYFTYHPSCINVPTSFYDKSHVPLNVSLTSRNWYINDQYVGNEDTLLYQFLVTGNHKVQLETTSTNGCSSAYSDTINVFDSYPSPVFDLVYPLNNHTTSDSIINFKWNKPISETLSYTFLISQDSSFNSIVFQKADIKTNFLSIILPLGFDTLYWKVRAFNPCLNYYETSPFKIHKFTPPKNNHLQLWLSANNAIIEEEKIAQWIDLSEKNNHTLQTAITKRPILIDSIETINNQPAINFDGIDDFLEFEAIDSIITAFFIVKHNTGTSSNYPPLLGHPNKYDWAGSTGTKLFNTTYLNPFIKNGEIYYNGELISPSEINKPLNFSLISFRTNGYVSAQYITNDRNGNGIWNGAYAELMIFDTVLSPPEMDLVHQYLRYKYTPPVNLLYDITIPYGFADTTITTAEKPWFTSYQWSTGENDTLPTLTVSKPGTYAVTVTDIFGFESTDSLRVMYPEFTIPANTTLCLGDTLRWNLDAKGPYSYEWSTGESDMDIDLFEAGAYSVTITDTLGNQWSPEPVVITIEHFPATASLGNDTTLCRGNRLLLQNGQSEAVGFLWNDGSTQPYYRIDQTETVTVQVTNALGCVAHDTIHIDVAGTAPVANFETGNLCRTYPVTFTNTSLALDGAEIESVLWNFNEQSTATTTHANYAFAQAGEVAITLTVNTNQGCTNDTTQTLRIHELPVSQFMPLQVCEGATLQLQNHSQSTDGEITAYAWQIADQWYNTAQPQHTFATAGSTFVQMVSRTEHNCPDTLKTYITVKPAPVAAFSYDTICMGSEAAFSNISTSQLGQQYTSQWHFADGSQSTTTHATHTFAQAGIEVITLIVRQLADGCADTLERRVNVHAVPVVNLTDAQTCVSTPTALEFTGTFGESENPGSVTWHVGDTTLYGASVQYLTQSDGVLPMQIRVRNAAGCQTHAEAALTVLPSPSVAFAHMPDTVYVPTTLQFENLSSEAQYNWLVNGTAFSQSVAPALPIDSVGLYIVELSGMDINGCVSQYRDTTHAVIPLNDVGISDCRAIIDQGRVYVSVDLYNGGTKTVTNPEMRLAFSNEQEFVEIYNGKLYPGKSTTYSFRTQYVVQPETTLDWLRTEVYYSVDQQLTNNSCIFVFGDEVRIFAPYPNPAQSTINIDVIVHEQGTVALQMHSLIGEQVLKTALEVAKGFNRLEITNPAPSSGIHILEVKIGNQKQRFKILL